MRELEFRKTYLNIRFSFWSSDGDDAYLNSVAHSIPVIYSSPFCFDFPSLADLTNTVVKGSCSWKVLHRQ